MIDLKVIINTFNNEEAQKFVSFLDKKNKRNDTKNIQLFKLLAHGEAKTSTICNQLYKNKNKGAYHALRKRLFQSLIDFTANQNLEGENSIDIQIIKYILASRSFLLQKNYKVAYTILDKAEKLADEHLLFSILNEIYHTKIQYAYAHPEADIEVLILKQKANQKKHLLEDQLNIVYSKIRSILNDINYKGQIINFEALLYDTLQEHQIELNESMSFKSLYQLLSIVNISALVSNDYFKIENFVVNTYNILKRKKDSDKQLFYQIQSVYIIANTFFRNKKFTQSLSYLNEMEDLMLHKKKANYTSFILKFTLLKSLNLNYTNQQNKAIALIETINSKKHSDVESLLDLNLCSAMFHFQSGNVVKAKQLFSKFYHTDKWYINKAGIDWVIKKNITEILLYIELNDEDLFTSRLNSFRKRYSKYLKQINQDRVIVFLKFVERYQKQPNKVISKAFANDIEQSFKWVSPYKEDIFVMSIYAWLKNKTEKHTLYETTLLLLKKAQSVK